MIKQIKVQLTQVTQIFGQSRLALVFIKGETSLQIFFNCSSLNSKFRKSYRISPSLLLCSSSETPLVPRRLPLSQLLLVKQRKPFNPPQSLSLSLLFLSSPSFLPPPFTTGPRGASPNRELFWKFINSSYSALPPPLCSPPFFPPPLPLRGPRRKTGSVTGPRGRKWRNSSPCCVGDNTTERVTQRLKLQAEDSFWCSSCHLAFNAAIKQFAIGWSALRAGRAGRPHRASVEGADVHVLLHSSI